MALIYTALLSIRGAAADLSRRLSRDERGQTILEYVVLGGFIAMAAAVALIVLTTSGVWTDMATTIENCVTFSSPCP